MGTFQGAVIGIGGIGIWHGQMMRDSKRIEVAALCDANEKMQARAAEHFPEAKFYLTPKEMFAKEKIDVVTIATPHDLHAPFAIEALRAGVNVIVEKPMATRYSDAQAMIAAARSNKRFLTVFHNRRLDGWYLAAKSVIDEGLLGNLIEINCGINFSPGPDTWRGYKQQSGGIMFDWGAHLVDYVLHFADSEVTAVSGFYYRVPGRDPALNENHGSIRIFFASGAMANVSCYGTSRVNPPRYYIIGERGTLIDEWNWGENDKLKVNTRLASGDGATMEVGYRKTNTQWFYDNIADHLANGTPLMVSAESAAKVIDIFCTAEQSHAQGGKPLPLAEA